MIEPNSDLPEFELRDVSAEKAQEPAQSGGCGCGCDHGAQLPRLDARPFPPRLRHPAILGAVSSLNVGEAIHSSVRDRAGSSRELKRPAVETLPDACVCHVLVSSLVHQFVFDTDL